MNVLETLEQFFVVPEKTNSKCSFGDFPTKITFKDSDAILYGIPLDITTSFGKGTLYGPEAIRITSAKQIESFLLYENQEIFKKIRIYDIGDLILVNSKVNDKHEKLLENNLKRISKINQINSLIRQEKKVPIILGGEHTLSYFSIKSLANEKPIIIHFDAHRDMKPIYEGKKMCHTTPFFHLIDEGHIKGDNIIQIGIRQSDKEENDIANNNGVYTFTSWDINKNLKEVTKKLRELTNKRKIYITFDIDVYDICYVPCTGTPEPFGLNPFQIIEIITSINKSTRLIGIDMVEVAIKNNDYREGTLATQTLYRILSSFY